MLLRQRLMLLRLELASLRRAKLWPRLSRTELVLILLLNTWIPAKLAVGDW